MADNDKKKYYWLKLQNDFFKRHEIKVVEAMPNGKDYVLFYLKLLCESTSHNGELRFSDTIPYSLEMLSAITNTNIDIIKSAIQIFQKLEMMDVYDDGTIFMLEVENMLGIETGSAIRKRAYREGLKETLLLEEKTEVGDTDGTDTGQCPQDNRYKILDNNKKENNKKKKDTFTKPTIEEIQAYINEKEYKDVNAEKFYYYYEAIGWLVGKGKKMKDWKSSVVTWHLNALENNNQSNNKPHQQQPTIVYEYNAGNEQPKQEISSAKATEMAKRLIAKGDTRDGRELKIMIMKGEIPYEPE